MYIPIKTVTALASASAFLFVLPTARRSGISARKLLPLTMLCAACAYVGTKVLAWVETGSFDSVSFYGAVFAAPAAAALFSRMLRARPSDGLDLCAVGVCFSGILMKLNCMRIGCCGGRFLFRTGRRYVFFPSQPAEALYFLILAVWLTVLILKGKRRGLAYPCFMVAYGFGRFFLNLLRRTTPFLWILPVGNVWSLVSLAVGLAWLRMAKRKADTGNVRKVLPEDPDIPDCNG